MIKGKFIVVIYFLISLSNCAHSQHEIIQRVVGGFEIDIKAVPYEVSLQENGSHSCGGSIINEEWILSAAHCTENKTAQELSIRAGSTKHSEGGVVVKVEKVVQNENYAGVAKSVDYDYVLLKLSRPLKYSKKIEPIALPEVNDDVVDGTSCLVSGWGLTLNENESRISLRAAKLPIINHEVCAKWFKPAGITPRMLCAGYEEGKISPCNQDSGSPLVCNGKIYGVVSFTAHQCALPKLPAVFAKVTAVRDWIKKTTGI